MRTRCTTFISMLLAVSASAALLSACGSNEEEQVTTLEGSYGDADAPQYTEPTIENLKGKPQKFPSRYPMQKYPNAKVTYAWVKKDLRPGMKNNVVMTTTDEIPTVRNFYIAQLVKDGWRLVDKYETLVYTSSTWQKDGFEAIVRVTIDPYGKKSVQLMYGPIKKRTKLPVQPQA